MDYVLSDLVARIVQTGQVSDGDVLALRDAVWSEDAIRRDVLDALFMINDRCHPTLPAWIEFFVEAAEHALGGRRVEHDQVRRRSERRDVDRQAEVDRRRGRGRRHARDRLRTAALAAAAEVVTLKATVVPDGKVLA